MTEPTVPVLSLEQALGVGLTVAGQQAAAQVATWTDDPAQMSEAAEAKLIDAGTVIAQALARFREDVLEVTRPFREGVAAINERARPVIEDLQAGKDRATVLYNRLQAYKAERARLLAAAEALELAFGAETASVAPPPLPPRPPVQGAVGRTRARTNLIVEIADIRLLAERHPELLELREAAAKKLIASERAAGRAEVAGLTYREERGSSFLRR